MTIEIKKENEQEIVSELEKAAGKASHYTVRNWDAFPARPRSQILVREAEWLSQPADLPIAVRLESILSPKSMIANLGPNW